MLVVAAAAFGLVPGGVDIYTHSWKHDTDTYSHAIHAGGWALVGWALAQVLAALHVRTRPSRLAGVQWIVIAIVIDVGGAVAWALENFTLDTMVPRWPGHVVLGCVGTVHVLVFVALPVVMIASKKTRPSDTPTARVV